MKFKHGEYVKCTIDETVIDDARISINEDGRYFICQDLVEGISADDKLGYKHSWKLEDSFAGVLVSNLRPAVKSFDYPEIGDEYIDSNGKSRFVLGVAGRVIFLSSPLSKDDFCSIFTKHDLVEMGYTIVPDEPNEKPTEMTLEEIEKLVGKKVKIVEKK